MKWFEYPEDEVRGYWLKAPYDKVFVGCDPRDGMSTNFAYSFDAFVNVSDSPCNAEPEDRRFGTVINGRQWNPTSKSWAIEDGEKA